MEKMNLKILQLISRIVFCSLIGILVIAIFSEPMSKILVVSGGWLFFTALIFEILYQILSGIKESKKIKQKKNTFKKLSTGSYKVKDNKANTCLGELSSENIDFLRCRFLGQGMDDNDFYFLSETLEMFLEEEQPNKELEEFLNNAMNSKNEIELHWQPEKET